MYIGQIGQQQGVKDMNRNEVDAYSNGKKSFENDPGQPCPYSKENQRYLFDSWYLGWDVAWEAWKRKQVD